MAKIISGKKNYIFEKIKDSKYLEHCENKENLETILDYLFRDMFVTQDPLGRRVFDELGLKFLLCLDFSPSSGSSFRLFSNEIAMSGIAIPPKNDLTKDFNAYAEEVRKADKLLNEDYDIVFVIG